jgi:hypothetical protein
VRAKESRNIEMSENLEVVVFGRVSAEGVYTSGVFSKNTQVAWFVVDAETPNSRSLQIVDLKPFAGVSTLA